LFSEGTYAETANNGGGYLSAFVTDGFSVTSGSSGDDAVNDSSDTYVAWNWKAGGASPSQTYVVKVVSDGGNKYRFDDFGTSAITLDLQEGGTYTFDQSDSSNSGHPFRFSTTANGTHGGGSEYTVGVTTNGTAGSAGAYTRITVASGAPTLYYYCTVHSGMGGQANTNSTFGSTNLKGATQAVVSANTTAGVSIIKYTGTGSATTVGHGLGVVPNLIIAKRRNATDGWLVYHSSRGASAYLYLNTTGSGETGVSYPWNGTSPTSSVFSVNSAASPSSSGTMIAYCFTNIESFSKAGLYVGNGSLDGVFVPLGFKPAWILTKRSNGTSWWGISDSARSTFNQVANTLAADATTTESALTSDLKVDFLSNGFKIRDTDAYYNASGENYIYIAFAEAPFKTTSAR
jgi:hypothetical protein